MHNEIFTISYTFNAPKQLVFNAFSTVEALNEWWGPGNATNSVISLDFKPGGIFHYKMEAGGHVNYGRFIFGRIEPYDLLEFTNAFADEHANPVKAPFGFDFPLEVFNRVTFSESNGKTTITLSGGPINATPEQIKVYKELNSSMQQGFSATFSQLAEYLAKSK